MWDLIFLTKTSRFDRLEPCEKNTWRFIRYETTIALYARTVYTLISLFRRRRGASRELLRRQFQTIIIMCSTSHTRTSTTAEQQTPGDRWLSPDLLTAATRSVRPSRRRPSPVRFRVAYNRDLKKLAPQETPGRGGGGNKNQRVVSRNVKCRQSKNTRENTFGYYLEFA